MARLRVMTYNIHRGFGTDGQQDLARIAAVIAGFSPDVLALQEVDVFKSRSGRIDQAHALAERLGLEARFGPTIEADGERYGIATLTRLAILDTRQVCLPWRERNPRSEPRCALVTRMRWDDLELDVINTHLAVRLGERHGQATTLLGALDDARPLIVAGDFNCTPWSRPFKLLRGALQTASSPRSWPSAFPLIPLDHILFRGPFRVLRSGLWRVPGARRASDHAPVVAELESIAVEAAA